MFQYTLRRMMLAVPTVFITVTIIFFVLRVLPGDPAYIVAGDNATEEMVQMIREELGLNKPIWQQYVEFLGAVVRLDFGESLISGKPVAQEIVDLIPHTLQLTLASVLISVIVGVPLGYVAVLKKDTWTDAICRLFGLLGISVPSFFFAIMLLLLFSLKIPLFPSMGVGEGWKDNLYHLALPALSLGLIEAGIVMRMTRSSMLEELNKDYVRTARAKGVPKNIVLVKHVLRNTLIPVITVIGLNITTLISGAVLTETVFSRPGLGSLVVGAIINRDYPILQGCLVLFSMMVIFVNLLVDLSYSLLNPRVRLK